MKVASGQVDIYMYNSEKLAHKNIGIATEIASISVSVVKLLVGPTSSLGYCFYFRIVPDAVLRSLTMLVLVKVDWVCPKTVS